MNQPLTPPAPATALDVALAETTARYRARNPSSDRIKALLFFDLLERGVFLARRGLVALSLPFGEAEVDTFVFALDAVVQPRQPLLPARTLSP